eukprot:1952225-Rhodomonas_salina.4
MSNGPGSVPVVSAAEVTGATASMLAGGYRGNGQQLCPVAPHSLAARGAVAVSGQSAVDLAAILRFDGRY